MCELQQLLPLPPNPSWRLLEEIARAAAAAGAGSALEYFRRSKNRCDEPEEKARLEAHIAGFKPLPALETRVNQRLVEQLELHYRKELEWNFLSDEDRASALKAPGLPKSRCKLVARIDGMWVRPEPDLQDRRQLAYLHGEHVCPTFRLTNPKY